MLTKKILIPLIISWCVFISLFLVNIAGAVSPSSWQDDGGGGVNWHIFDHSCTFQVPIVQIGTYYNYWCANPYLGYHGHHAQ